MIDKRDVRIVEMSLSLAIDTTATLSASVRDVLYHTRTRRSESWISGFDDGRLGGWPRTAQRMLTQVSSANYMRGHAAGAVAYDGWRSFVVLFSFFEPTGHMP